MNRKGESLYLPDDIQIQAARQDGYRKGWNDRRELDSAMIGDVLKQTRNFREFAQILREKISEMDGESE
jgi:hypothetical protein